jgi:hypothetical protein
LLLLPDERLSNRNANDLIVSDSSPYCRMGDNSKQMSCPKVLRDAIEGLYVAFAGYPLPEDTMPCGCCHTPTADSLLHAEPLRQMGWEHLADYATDALLVWGT